MSKIVILKRHSVPHAGAPRNVVCAAVGVLFAIVALVSAGVWKWNKWNERRLRTNTQDAIRLCKEGNWIDAFALSRDADKSDQAMQFSLGWMYANGNGVAKDEKEAVQWYRRAAVKGHRSGF